MESFDYVFLYMVCSFRSNIWSLIYLDLSFVHSVRKKSDFSFLHRADPVKPSNDIFISPSKFFSSVICLYFSHFCFQILLCFTGNIFHCFFKLIEQSKPFHSDLHFTEDMEGFSIGSEESQSLPKGVVGFCDALKQFLLQYQGTLSCVIISLPHYPGRSQVS